MDPITLPFWLTIPVFSWLAITLFDHLTALESKQKPTSKRKG